MGAKADFLASLAGTSVNKLSERLLAGLAGKMPGLMSDAEVNLLMKQKNEVARKLADAMVALEEDQRQNAAADAAVNEALDTLAALKEAHDAEADETKKARILKDASVMAAEVKRLRTAAEAEHADDATFVAFVETYQAAFNQYNTVIAETQNALANAQAEMKLAQAKKDQALLQQRLAEAKSAGPDAGTLNIALKAMKDKARETDVATRQATILTDDMAATNDSGAAAIIARTKAASAAKMPTDDPFAALNS